MRSNPLELYAKIENMLDFSEAIATLYGAFYEKIRELKPKSVIDIGCGSGAFGLGLIKEGYEVFGVDLSAKMVENSVKAGLRAENIDVCDVKESFGAATAVFDVLNYMDEAALARFFACVRGVLDDGGYFLADVNTHYGFDEIAQGVIAVRGEGRFATLEATFENSELITDITLFTECENGLFEKEEGSIVQYYHDKKTIQKLCGMNIVDIVKITLYGDKPDKYLYTFKK